MKRHWTYFKYVARHRWYVFVECCKRGIVWQGLWHDISKYSRLEWPAYVGRFGGGIKMGLDKAGHYENAKDTHQFIVAWFWHQARNKHHWQFWLLPHDNGVTFVDIPLRYRKEMLADWIGASRAQGAQCVLDWYTENRSKIHLHGATRLWIENEIGYVQNEKKHSAEESEER